MARAELFDASGGMAGEEAVPRIRERGPRRGGRGGRAARREATGVAGSWNVVDLFNAHLADEKDLRTLSIRPPTAARSLRRPRRPGPRKARSLTRSPRRAVRAPAAKERGLLVVLDESRAARRAVDYVARLVGRHRGFRVCLAYALPQLPPKLLEHGGAGNPQVEERLASALRFERRRWIAERKRAARGVLDEAVASLRRAGLSSRGLSTRFCGPVRAGSAAEEILRLARAQRCRTVVVGRRTLSWFGHLFAHDLREDLVRRDGRIAIWGIG